MALEPEVVSGETGPSQELIDMRRRLWIGLALVRQIARRHGGEAVCLAAEGGGSRFRIDLPIAER